jgi:hypothetical protein
MGWHKSVVQHSNRYSIILTTDIVYRERYTCAMARSQGSIGFAALAALGSLPLCSRCCFLIGASVSFGADLRSRLLAQPDGCSSDPCHSWVDDCLGHGTADPASDGHGEASGLIF